MSSQMRHYQVPQLSSREVAAKLFDLWLSQHMDAPLQDVLRAKEIAKQAATLQEAV